MTIIVTWQLRVTFDNIRNNWDVCTICACIVINNIRAVAIGLILYKNEIWVATNVEINKQTKPTYSTCHMFQAKILLQNITLDGVTTTGLLKRTQHFRILSYFVSIGNEKLYR